jgi:hypothetical protein
MADIIQASLQGSILRFQSALDGLRIVLFEKVAPALTSTINALAKFFNIVAKGAETPMSEMLEQDRLKLRQFEIELKTSNTSQEDRVKIIKELKRLYPDYLKDLDAEKATNEQLTTALQNVNEQLANKILLQRENEKIAEQAEDEADRLQNVIEREDVLKDLMADLVDTEGFVIKENVSLIEQGEDIISQLQESYRKQNIGGRPQELRDVENAVKFLAKAEEKYNKEVESGVRLTEERKKLMERLGIKPEDIPTPTTTTTTKTEGTPAGDGVDPATTALGQAELTLQEWILATKTSFANKEIETKEELNSRLYDIQIVHLENMLEIENLSAEQRIGIEEKIANLRVKKREDDIKATEAAEKTKADLIKANIDNAMGIGKSLTEIGKLMGENSAAAKAGIAVTKAASVAKAIEGIINAKTAIADQASSGDPYSAFARMALMASAVAPLIASLMALKGGGGGGGSSDGEATFLQDSQGNQFANGGLTRGGMFQGNSHANGGVKFRVGGRIHEAEGGEAIINKKSTSMFRPVLSAINSYNGNGVKFADGGLLNSGEKFAMGGELRSAQQLISGGVGTSKVVIVESDMTEVQNRISAIESQATF